MPHPGFRIFVLGAGFSRPAGLPLASELFPLVKNSIEERHGRDTKFHKDLADYIRYKKLADGEEVHESAVDLEALHSHLDIEHFLGLRGSDTWSKEGNESQLMIRRAIGEVIHRHTPALDKLPSAYYRFAENLSLHDWVLTLNYDLVLERALEHVGKPYRLFPHRFVDVGEHLNVVDSSKEEVILLKLHGSVDWFHNASFLEQRASLGPRTAAGPVVHEVFDFPERFGVSPLVEGPRQPDDPLRHVQRIKNCDAFYRSSRGFDAPFILSPSHVKFVYAQPLLSFWHGMGQSGGWNLGLNVIGFSLPQHDEYIRVGLYQMIRNFQFYSWDTNFFGHHKDYVKFVDFQASRDGMNRYLKRYAFSEPSRSAFLFAGFGDDAVEFLFTQQRPAPTNIVTGAIG
ncbi:SIR2 family protein [Ramlibacter montanisoli]|uniref:SIR2-like domain-containing protein n=1 Tax=Ramlibacter montanisoli TaxID=2732512 RepID=A0A849KII2_9BURK|nr:SIR2 family protein [Ramlibacter montanisoli]NNU45236.1 hypothetical protein [Ramlibacter montanisoli]